VAPAPLLLLLLLLLFLQMAGKYSSRPEEGQR